MDLFGVLLLDREPLGLANVPGLAFAWLQDAGGFAALGLVLYLLSAMTAPRDQSVSNKLRKPVTKFMVGMAVLSLLTYALLAASLILGVGKTPLEELPKPVQPGETQKYMPPKVLLYGQPCLLALGGLFAIMGIAQPFVRDLFKLRFRRVYALIKVCFLEAIRNRVFFVFLIYMLVFLFPASWFSSIKAEDELRTPIMVFSMAKNILLTIPFLILAAFAIPTDVKTNTLYTIVTKPVERFEIVLGRFFGYGALMTVVLLGYVTVSVLYIGSSKFDEKAQEESYKARVTDRGTLTFKAFRSSYDGTNVGREFEYRRYIGGSPSTRERAIWAFNDVPGNLTRRDRDSVPVEFTFDIFRLTKGVENRGVDCNIRICAWQVGQVPSPTQGEGLWYWTNKSESEKYEAERQAINDKLKTGGYGTGYERSLDFAKPGTPTWDLVDGLARKYGFFEVPSVEAYDYRPCSIVVPVGLFAKAAEGATPRDEDGKPLPRFSIYVKCLSPGQMLGMAEADLYVVEGEKSFAENYYKSAFGLWCRLLFVIGLAVTFSTYFPALISAFAAAVLYVLAYFSEHIQDIAARTNVGGGPFESSLRAFRGEAPTMPLDATGAMKAITWGDDFFAWFIRRFTNVIPDVDAFVWSEFLAEGFNVNAEYLVVNLLVLVGYLLPWGVLAYYLMNNREVAA